MAELILASGSRFRRQMLEAAGVPVRVIPADVDEPDLRDSMLREEPDITAGRIALRLAEAKALHVSKQHQSALIIGADQILDFNTAILAKPANPARAREHLELLRGRTHTLPTAVVLAQAGKVLWQHVETPRLTMRAFSDEFLAGYLNAMGDSVLETVGAYKLEGLGVQLFERTDGDSFSIIGLPLLPLLDALRRFGHLPS
jgi:septum formation protein